jgi:hypothetical protein
MIFGISCGLEVNTTDPQASVNINSSKRDNLYLCEYQSHQIPNNIFKISEAWIENVWFNKFNNGEKIKSKIKEIQLCLKIIDYRNVEFKENKYLIEWLMKDKKNNSFGQSNGVYVLDFENEKIPDSINISISKYKNDRTTSDIFNFLLTKKN